ncbi:MAG TPA: TetR/AcrR family transcriptional regulator [Thiobacillus sp.]|nr:TetR/AcrR family transcriptional regulator [Thiobacillus sp.]
MLRMGSKGEKTRAEIVESARKLFYEQGYDGTSFSHIVDATGLYRGNIYHYFKTKDEILEAVVERYLIDYKALLTQWEHESSDPKMRLLAFVGMITGHKSELVEYGCPIGSLNTELGKERRALQHAARALFDLLKAWLAAQLAEMGYGNEADKLALHLLGRAQGIAVISHVYQDKQLLERETAQLENWIKQL